MADFPVEVLSWFRGFSCTGSGTIHVHMEDMELLCRASPCRHTVGFAKWSWGSAGLSSPVKGR